MTNLKYFYIFVGVVVILFFVGCDKKTSDSIEVQSSTIRLVVMDPLCAKLACDCVEGYAQRNYERLGEFLSEKLNTKVSVDYGEDLAQVIKLDGAAIDLIAGKSSLVRYDAKRANLSIRPIGELTGLGGSVSLHGMIVVRSDDHAENLADLKGRTILFGPDSETEKSAAAIDAFKAAGITLEQPLERRLSCNAAAIDVSENTADAAVISSYAMPLLQGCSTIDEGSLKIIGRTKDVPFIRIFATDSVDSEMAERITEALMEVKKDSELLRSMESKSGFVRGS